VIVDDATHEAVAIVVEHCMADQSSRRGGTNTTTKDRRDLGGLTPVEYARRLTEKVITNPGKTLNPPATQLGGTSAPADHDPERAWRQGGSEQA
jgi:hypothetical protein